MYRDEEILKRKEELKREQEQAIEREKAEQEKKNQVLPSIYDEEVQLGTLVMTYERREIALLECSMIIPNILEVVDEATAKLMYPNATLPQIVYSCEEQYMNIMCHRTPELIQKEHVKPYLKSIKLAMECVGPNVKIIRTREEIVRDYTIGVLEFRSKSITGGLYNYMIVIPTEHGINIITMNICDRYSKEMESLVDEMIQSYESPLKGV